METGAARASELAPGAPVLFVDADLQSSAANLGVLLGPVRSGEADLTIAVSLSGPRSTQTSQQPVSELADSEGVLGDLAGRLRRGVLESDQVRGVLDWWQARFASDAEQPEFAVGGSRQGNAAGELTEFDELPKGLRTLDVVSLTLETTQALITRFRMAASPPDVLIEFPQDIATTFEFHRAAELIAQGRTRAAKALDEAGL